jgi:hypothetical protein
MVDVNWSMRPETQFSGWLDYLEPESVSFCKRWLHYQAGCLRIFRRAPEGVGQSSQQQQRLPGPGEAALIHEICKLHSKFTFDDDEPRPEKDPDDPSAATLGIEFRWQGRMMRFRASHPVRVCVGVQGKAVEGRTSCTPCLTPVPIPTSFACLRATSVG